MTEGIHYGVLPKLTWDNHNELLGITIGPEIQKQYDDYMAGLHRFLMANGIPSGLFPFKEETPKAKDKPSLRQTKSLLTKNIHILPKESGHGRSGPKSKRPPNNSATRRKRNNFTGRMG